MDVKKIKEDGLKRSFNVTISKEDILKRKEEDLKHLAKKVKMQGFREGKVPLDIVEKNYKQALLTNVFENLTKEALTKIYKDFKIAPIVQPEIKIEKGNPMEEQDVELTLNFEVYPELPEIKLDEITLNKTILEVSEEDINDFLSQLANHYKSFEDIEEDRALEKGDIAVINFVGKIDGVAFEGGSGENYPLELGSGTFIPGFEDQLIGKKKNETVTVQVKFPENYHEHLANKDAEFEVTINKIQKAVPSKFEDIPSKIGLESLDELKKDIKDRYTQQYQQVSKQELKTQLVEELPKRVEFTLPEVLIEREKHILWHDYEHFKKNMEDLKAKGEKPRANVLYDNKSEEEIKKEQEEQALRRIKLSLIFNDIADKNNIYVLDEEVEQSIKQESSKFGGREKEVINYYKTNQQALNHLRNYILEDKILDYILSQVKYNETTKSLKEYNEGLKEEGTK